MQFSSILGLVCLTPGTIAGLVGMGIDMYNPACAHAGSRAIASNPLSCSSHDASGGHMHGSSGMTSAQCRASDVAFLTTLAWCVSTRCARYRVPTSKLEEFWEEQCTGDPTVSPHGTTGRRFSMLLNHQRKTECG